MNLQVPAVGGRSQTNGWQAGGFALSFEGCRWQCTWWNVSAKHTGFRPPSWAVRVYMARPRAMVKRFRNRIGISTVVVVVIWIAPQGVRMKAVELNSVYRPWVKNRTPKCLRCRCLKRLFQSLSNAKLILNILNHPRLANLATETWCWSNLGQSQTCSWEVGHEHSGRQFLISLLFMHE